MQNDKIKPISINETIREIDDIKRAVPPYYAEYKKLNELKSRLIETHKYLIIKQDSWHPPSIIIGALGGIAISLLIFAADAQSAERDSLDINLTSYHFDNTYNYNTKNYGIGYTKSINNHWQGKAGYFKNSYNKDSFYLMAKLKHDMQNWRWGVQFGFVTGYDNIEKKQDMQSKFPDGQKTNAHRYHESDEREHSISKQAQNIPSHSHAKNMNRFQFLIMPTITWKATKQHALQFGYIPAIEKKSIAVITMQYQYSF